MTKSIIAVFLTALLLFPVSMAYISVEIFPATGEKTITLYPEEKAQFKIIIKNLSDKKTENFTVTAFVDNGLNIIDEMEKTQSKTWHFEEIKGGSTNEVLFSVKPAESQGITQREKKKITVYYGQNTQTNYTGTYLEVTPRPLYIEATIEKPTMNPNEENSIILTIQNRGKMPLTNIKGEIILPSKAHASETTFSIQKLAPQTGFQPGEKIENKRFPFTIEEGLSGENPVIVRIQFEDEKGTHIVEKDVSFSVQDKTLIFYLIVFTILILIIIALLSRKNKKGIIDSKETEKTKKQFQQ